MIDDLIPHPEFSERHSRRVAADPDTVWAALSSITPADLTITRPLVALRHLGRSTVPSDRPLLTDGPLPLLHVEGRCAVAGTVARPWQRRPSHRRVADLDDYLRFAEPGWAKYLTEFSVEPSGAGSVLRTVTAGTCTDAKARRRFRAYWTLIRIPSGLIRRDVLRAVARESTTPRRRWDHHDDR